MMGVSIAPGLMTFVRVLRSFTSVAHVRAKEGSAAFVALQVLYDGKPFSQTQEPLRMMEKRISILRFCAATVLYKLSRSSSLDTSLRTAVTHLPISLTALSSSVWRRPVINP